MRRHLSVRERRSAALLVLVVLIYAAWWLLVDSWFATPLADIDQQIDDLRDQQQRYASLLAQRPALQEQLAAARHDPAGRSSLLPGDDPSAVAAQLMQLTVERVKTHAEQGPGCEVSQRMPITPEQNSAEPWRQVKVSLTLDCAAQPLALLLHDLEYGQPSLFVDALSVQRAADAPAGGGPGRLRVHLLVRGYLQPASAQVAP